VSIKILPAFPLPEVSTLILPLPVRLIVSGAAISISPPSPLPNVDAEIVPSSVNTIFRFTSLLGLMVRFPASATPSVSAKMPNSPEILT
jgi:hypothetical protein